MGRPVSCTVTRKHAQTPCEDNHGSYITRYMERLLSRQCKLPSIVYSVIPGECWAGHTSKNNYMSLGKAAPDTCLGDDYKPCGAFDRYCMGKQWTNMVYKIAKLV